MSSYGQFCSIARAHEVLGTRWTLLIVRELFMGSRRFGEVQKAIPRISKTMLSARLKTLVAARIVDVVESPDGRQYFLTDSGKELSDLLMSLGTWGQRWLPRSPLDEDLDLEPVLLDMRRRVRFEAVPERPVVIRFDLEGHRPRYLLLRPEEASVCTHNPGFDECTRVSGPAGALVAWWRGDVDFEGARRLGLRLNGARQFARQFPLWFERYLFADIRPADVVRP